MGDRPGEGRQRPALANLDAWPLIRATAALLDGARRRQRRRIAEVAQAGVEILVVESLVSWRAWSWLGSR